MITPTQDPLFVKLRAFVLSLIPGIEVVQGLGNGVPMPEGGFVCMTATLQQRLSTNHTEFDGLNQRTVTQPTKYGIQVDCYGADSSDWATALSAMYRDDYGCDVLGPECQPLYNTDPIQVPLVDGEENYLMRWTFTALLQFNPVVTVPQQYADELNLDLVSVDATFPP